jgi:hypothetical protein
MSFFKKKILHLKGGGGCGFKFTIYFFVNIVIIYILLSHF